MKGKLSIIATAIIAFVLVFCLAASIAPTTTVAAANDKNATLVLRADKCFMGSSPKGKKNATMHVEATDLLLDPKLLKDAKNVVVVGGGVVGCETAYYLSYEHGRNVTVVEMLPHFMEGSCTANRGHLIHYLKKAGVKLLNCAKVTGFDEKHVLVEQNAHAALSIADVGYVIETGAITLSGPGPELLHNEQVQSAYLGM